jgi:hypothetical protein
MKSYLIQETIARFHDVIGDLDEYALQVWKEQSDVWEIGMIFIFIQSNFFNIYEGQNTKMQCNILYISFQKKFTIEENAMSIEKQ